MKKNPTLPIELIREILLRLPVRSVLRFKCVCKSWLSLISDPQFGISHYDLAASPSHRLLLRSNYFYAQSIDIDTPLHKCDAVYLLHPPPSPPRNPPDFEDYDDFRYEPYALGSCRGFILLNYARTDELILWNPSLGVHKLLPLLDFQLCNITIYLFGFGYDPSTDDYLLIVIQLCEEEDHDESRILIFPFKTYLCDIQYITGSYLDLGHKFKAGSLLNDALHWFVLSEDDNEYVIIAFDLIHRSLSEIPVLEDLTSGKYDFYGLREVEGCLSLSCLVHGDKTAEIWVMKEYKVQSSWTKFIVVSTNYIPCYNLDSPFYSHFTPICIAKDGGIVGSNATRRLEKLNDEGELLEVLTYGGFERLYCINLQSAMYRESLLSIPSVVREAGEDEQQ